MGIAPDVLINDRYRLVERIAVGSTGQVWRATDLVLTRQVAVKILHPERLDDPMFRERFRAEARHAAQLSHPGVAEVHDYGEEGDLAFLVMEYLPGKPLAAILEEHHHEGDADNLGSGGLVLSIPSTLEIVAQVARALQAAHDIGLIHRDVKPANLIVGPEGDVKITDFGTARALDASTVTEPGVVVGTAQYLSPEQAEGRPLTPAADIYALGVVAYTCLAGQPPFCAASPVDIAAAHVQEDPPPLPETVPAPTSELVASCLAKDPNERPSSAAEVAQRCVTSHEVPPSVPTVAGAARPRRRPAPLSAATAGAALAVGGMLLVGPGYAFLAPIPVVENEQVQPSDSEARPEPRPDEVSGDTGQRYGSAVSASPSPPEGQDHGATPRRPSGPADRMVRRGGPASAPGPPQRSTSDKSPTTVPPRDPVASSSTPKETSPSPSPSGSASRRTSESPAPTESRLKLWETGAPAPSPGGPESPTPSPTAPSPTAPTPTTPESAGETPALPDTLLPLPGESSTASPDAPGDSESPEPDGSVSDRPGLVDHGLPDVIRTPLGSLLK